MHVLSYCLTLLLTIVSAVTFGIDLYVNYNVGMGMNNERKFKDITNQYMTQITPANWIFQIWNVIYVLLIIWYIYIFLLFFRQLCSGRNKSPIFPGIFWLVFIIINVLNGLWVHLYANDNMVVTGIIILILTLMTYLINMIAFRVCWMDVTYDKSNNEDNDYERNRDEDIVELSRFEVGLLRFLTLNGLPLYAIWCTVASALQWTMIFQYFTFHWNGSLASIVTLSVLSVVLLFYWFMEIVSQRKYFVYTWLPSIALVVAFGAIIDRYGNLGGSRRPGLSFACALMIISIAMLLVKFVTLCCCPPRYDSPRFSRV